MSQIFPPTVEATVFVYMDYDYDYDLSLIHISEPTRRTERSRMPSSA